MPSLPTGTVTFLFTDIEGSTTLLQPRNSGWVLRSNALSLNFERGEGDLCTESGVSH